MTAFLWCVVVYAAWRVSRFVRAYRAKDHHGSLSIPLIVLGLWAAYLLAA